MANNELMVGMPAPDFPSLQELHGKVIVLYFYPKDDTPGCTKEACGFRDVFNDIKKLGGVVIGVSKDSEESHQRFQKKYNLNFQLLSDPNEKIISDYGVQKERATFVIDHEGIIRRIWRKVSVERHVEEVTYFVKLLQGQKAQGMLRAGMNGTPGCST